MKRGLKIVSGSVAVPVMLGGCININAPAEPIVIELNINIRQEVIYRLAEDVKENIEENADIF
ncbi:YnbE family lipoprotein [Erythrobacter sp. SDW2]|uniref:YnbE family lipoprotein n=1 Tax=Erythrobacter sp. SDW2 TaxID=2907154 RepID=UPI001F1DDC69|nr:YnbE family lipoprotein [Erythrobacter sp. SDW2]UIP05518.1 YnbE family lipoprotein [Erythrobacter sp. SDW2]